MTTQLIRACISMIELTEQERYSLAVKNKVKLDENFSKDNFENRLDEIVFFDETQRT